METLRLEQLQDRDTFSSMMARMSDTVSESLGSFVLETNEILSATVARMDALDRSITGMQSSKSSDLQAEVGLVPESVVDTNFIKELRIDVSTANDALRGRLHELVSMCDNALGRLKSGHRTQQEEDFEKMQTLPSDSPPQPLAAISELEEGVEGSSVESEVPRRDATQIPKGASVETEPLQRKESIEVPVPKIANFDLAAAASKEHMTLPLSNAPQCASSPTLPSRDLSPVADDLDGSVKILRQGSVPVLTKTEDSYGGTQQVTVASSPRYQPSTPRGDSTLPPAHSPRTIPAGLPVILPSAPILVVKPPKGAASPLSHGSQCSTSASYVAGGPKAHPATASFPSALSPRVPGRASPSVSLSPRIPPGGMHALYGGSGHLPIAGGSSGQAAAGMYFSSVGSENSLPFAPPSGLHPPGGSSARVPVAAQQCAANFPKMHPATGGSASLPGAGCRVSSVMMSTASSVRSAPAQGVRPTDQPLSKGSPGLDSRARVYM